MSASIADQITEAQSRIAEKNDRYTYYRDIAAAGVTETSTAKDVAFANDAASTALANKIAMENDLKKLVAIKDSADAAAAERAAQAPPVPAETAVATPVADRGLVITTDLAPENEEKLQAAEAAGVNLFAGEADQYLASKALLSSNDDKPNSTSDTTLDPIAEGLKLSANPLHEYATYTYGLSLFMLHKDEFNILQKTDVAGGTSWDPAYAIISSAGKYNTPSSGHNADGEYFNTGRLVPFQDVDFYFDNLRMTTVVGMNSRTRGTNAIDIGFTIIEPMGMTLLNRIIDAASDQHGPIQSKNYIAQPYLLQIDFFGSRDLGDIAAPIRNLRKRFPIKIIEMKIKATAKGSEYAIKAIPYSHQSLQETMASTPVNLEVVASDVGNFFGSLVPNTTFTKQYDQVRTTNEGAQINAQSNARALRNGSPATSPVSTTIPADTPFRVESYTDAMNAWFQRLVEKGNCDVADEIGFFFHENFRTSKIVNPATSNPKNTAFVDARTNQKAIAGAGRGGHGVDRSLNVFPISAATSVTEVINIVMRNSEFIKNQVFDPTGKSSSFRKDAKVNFYKIVPHITLKDFDVKRNRYAMKTIYYIIPYDYWNTKHPNLPYATPTSTSKEYNYIYTGKNVDIIDFQIDFDSAFYTAVQVDRANASQDAPVPNGDDPDAMDRTPGLRGVSKDGVQQPTVEFRTGDKGAASTDVDNANAALVANAVKSIYSSSRGDMINVKLKIIGDPDFIKQDDLYTNPGQNIEGDNKPVATNGTIMMDSSEVFVRISFKTPTDIDESTGLADPHKGGKYSVSKFSGVYKVLTVDNELSRGQFVQTLDTIKIFDDNAPQPDRRLDASGKLNAANDPRVVKPADNTVSADTLTSKLDGVKLGEVVSNPIAIADESRTGINPSIANESENPALDQAKAEAANLNRFLRNT